MTSPRAAATVRSLLAAAVALVALGCSGDTTEADRAKIEASYRNPVNDGRASCLGESIVKRADEVGVDVAALANRIADIDATDTPHFDQDQAGVIAEALLDCPAPSTTSTTSTLPEPTAGLEPLPTTVAPDTTAPAPDTVPDATDPGPTDPGATETAPL